MKDITKRILKILNENEFGELSRGNKYITGVKTEHFTKIAVEITTMISERQEETKTNDQAESEPLRIASVSNNEVVVCPICKGDTNLDKFGNIKCVKCGFAWANDRLTTICKKHH